MSTNALENTELRPSAAPFTHEDADVILRSSDGIDFRVHKIVLSLASSVFKDMFRVGRSTKQQDDDEQNWKDGLPVVSLTEPHDLLKKLLSQIYPMFPCALADDDIFPWIEGARKYDIEIARNTGRICLTQLAETAPLRVFAQAASFELWEEAKIAALASLKFSFDGLLSNSPQFQGMSGPEYGALLLFHKHCGIAASRVVWDFCTYGNFMRPVAHHPDNEEREYTHGCANSACFPGSHSHFPPTRVADTRIPRWLLGYLADAAARLEHTPMARLDKTSPIAAAFEVGNCGRCQEYMRDKFAAFLVDLQSAVSKAIANVPPIDLPIH